MEIGGQKFRDDGPLIEIEGQELRDEGPELHDEGPEFHDETGLIQFGGQKIQSGLSF